MGFQMDCYAEWMCHLLTDVPKCSGCYWKRLYEHEKRSFRCHSYWSIFCQFSDLGTPVETQRRVWPDILQVRSVIKFARWTSGTLQNWKRATQYQDLTLFTGPCFVASPEERFSQSQKGTVLMSTIHLNFAPSISSLPLTRQMLQIGIVLTGCYVRAIQKRWLFTMILVIHATPMTRREVNSSPTKMPIDYVICRVCAKFACSSVAAAT